MVTMLSLWRALFYVRHLKYTDGERDTDRRCGPPGNILQTSFHKSLAGKRYSRLIYYRCGRRPQMHRHAGDLLPYCSGVHTEKRWLRLSLEEI